MESNSDDFFFFQKLQEEFPKVFSFARFDDLPFDKQNVRYSNWKEVYNNMLELAEKDKFLKLPQDIFNFLVLSISFEEILDFLNKICSHKSDYCDKRQDFWILLWKRDVNNNPPLFHGVKEKYLAFINEFHKGFNKIEIAAKFGAINQPIFISKFNEEINIQEKFYLASKFGAINLINDLINRVDISADSYKALRSAAAYGHLEVVHLLINLDSEGIKADNYVALRLAAYYGYLEIVHILANLDPEGIKVDNYYPLHLATKNGHLEIVRVLLSKIENISEIPDNIKILIRDKFNILI